MAHSNTVRLAAQPGLPTIPRLADFRLEYTSSPISPLLVGAMARAADMLALAASGAAIAVLYVPERDTFGSGQYALAIGLTTVLALLILGALGLYRTPVLLAPARFLPRLAMGWTIALGLLVAGVFFLKLGPEYSRVWLACWYAAGALALGTARLGLSFAARQWGREGRLSRRAVIYGSGPACEELLAELDTDPASDIRICGIFDERGLDRAAPVTAGYRKLGGLADLVRFARQTRIDVIIIALPLAAEARLLRILRQLWVLPADIRLAASASRLRLRPRAYSYLGSVALIDLADKAVRDWGGIAKWLFDKAVGAAALVALAPVMVAVALAIKLDSRGPALFRQKRYGFNNELIEVFKFRSMYADQADANAARLVSKGDPRVTRVGRFIRRTSLDELPQLFNVLTGELSLVGPRPHALFAKAADKLYADAVDSYFARHKVKPGITGWAQVNGWRGETETQEKLEKRIEHDLYYVENWSLLFDLLILARTPFALLKTENAY